MFPGIFKKFSYKKRENEKMRSDIFSSFPVFSVVSRQLNEPRLPHAMAGSAF